jgi:hypothetical protein
MTIRPRESPESFSPIIAWAVAAGLRGEYVENYQLPSASGLPPETLSAFSLDDLIQVRLDDYTQLNKKFPALIVGTASGGATTYLSLAP